VVRARGRGAARRAGAAAAVCLAALGACGRDGVRERAVAAGPAKAAPYIPPVVATTAPAESFLDPMGQANAHLKPGQLVAVMDALNRGEVAQAQLALGRAATDPARSFAQAMARDHAAALQQDAAVADSLKAAPEPSATLEHTERAGQQVMAELGKPAGRAFDQVYLDQQIHLHQAALDLIDQRLLPDASDPLLQGALREQRGTVAGHLQVAIQLRRKLGT
jgi:putative membrane protein